MGVAPLEVPIAGAFHRSEPTFALPSSRGAAPRVCEPGLPKGGEITQATMSAIEGLYEIVVRDFIRWFKGFVQVSKCALFLVSNYWEPYINYSLIFKK